MSSGLGFQAPRLPGFPNDMRTLKLTVAYDGTNYVGWQRQTNGLSIQQVLEEAFAPLDDGEMRTMAGAGRTDAGVHALGQVASIHVDFDLAPSAVQRALNVRLPQDIRVLGVVDATPGFHAQFHSTGKAYRYRIATTAVLSPFDRWFVWHAPGPRNVAAMQRAAAQFLGEHDFASFQPADAPVRDTVRTIDRLSVRDAGGEIVIDVEGDHWRWSISEVPGLGVSLAPSFTVLMETDEPERIAFTHDPPEGRRERAGVEGVYTLEDVEHDGSPATRLGIELTVRVDLPLAKVAKPAVKAAIDGVLASMGRGFSKGLLKRLDAEQVD